MVVAVGADAQVGFKICNEKGFFAAFALYEIWVGSFGLAQGHRGLEYLGFEGGLGGSCPCRLINKEAGTET